MIDFQRQPLVLHGLGLFAGLMLLSYGSCVLVDGISAQRRHARNSGPAAVPTVPDSGIPAAAETARVKFLFQDRWYLETVDKSQKVELPEFLPGPGQFNPPARAIAVEDLAEVLMASIDEEGRFSGERELAELAEVRVAGTHPFRGLLSSGSAEKAGPITSTGKDRVATSSSPTTIPPEIDPDTAQFRRAMGDWREQVVSRLESLSPSASPFRISFIHPTESRQVTLLLFDQARSRVVSAEFGRQNRDTMIFLQVLANMYGMEQSVDGRYGPRTEQGLRRLIGVAFGQPNAADAYIEKVQKYK